MAEVLARLSRPYARVFRPYGVGVVLCFVVLSARMRGSGGIARNLNLRVIWVEEEMTYG